MQDRTNRQEALEARLSQILQRSDFPALAEHIQELLARLADPNANASTISTIVGKDVGLSLRIIRTANSIQYNRSGKPILALPHAVALMGMETIRELAAGLMMVNHFRNRPPGVRQLLALSLLSANHARQGALVTHYPRTEEAYLCGLFRNLGEVLIACYFPADYALVLAAMQEKGGGEREACLRVLEFPFEELGREVVRRWNLPPQVSQVLDSAAPLVVSHPHTEEQHLALLAGFGHELTAAMHRVAPNQSTQRVDRVLKSFGKSLKISDKALAKIAHAAVEETKATFKALNLPLDELRLERQVELALSSGLLAPPGPVGGEEEASPEWAELARDIHNADLQSLLSRILDLGMSLGGFERAIFGLVSPNHDSVCARLHAGSTDAEWMGRFQFPLERRAGPVTAALVGKRDLFVCGGPYLDSDFARRLDTGCFALLPVVINGILAGCLYFDRKAPPGSVKGPEPAVPPNLVRARDMAAEAIAAARHPL
ncbi:MAG: HDOD domain-containing protein [Acidobacteriota bacterium]